MMGKEKAVAGTVALAGKSGLQERSAEEGHVDGEMGMEVSVPEVRVSQESSRETASTYDGVRV